MVRLCDELRIEHVRLEPQFRVVSDRKLALLSWLRCDCLGRFVEPFLTLLASGNHLDGGDDQKVVSACVWILVLSRECSLVFCLFSISSICCPPGLCKGFNLEIMSFLRDLILRQLYFGRVKVHSQQIM